MIRWKDREEIPHQFSLFSFSFDLLNLCSSFSKTTVLGFILLEKKVRQGTQTLGCKVAYIVPLHPAVNFETDNKVLFIIFFKKTMKRMILVLNSHRLILQLLKQEECK